MFAPEGYLPVSQLVRMVPEIAHDAAYSIIERSFFIGQEIRVRQYAFDIGTPEDSIEYELFRFIGDNCRICSSGGDLLRIDLRSALWEVEMYLVDISLFLAKGEFHFAPHQYIDFKLLKVTWKELVEASGGACNEKEISSLRFPLESVGYFGGLHREVPLFFERNGYTISLDAFDALRPLNVSNIQELDGTIERFRPFTGWAMCIPENILGPRWDQTWQRFIGERQDGAFGSTELIGRPPDKRIATAAAYASLYPKGHGTEAWLRVLQRVNEKSGYNVSVDTLRRAVRTLNAFGDPHNQEQNSVESTQNPAQK